MRLREAAIVMLLRRRMSWSGWPRVIGRLSDWMRWESAGPGGASSSL